VKAQFSVPAGVYLLSHSVGCLPVGSQAALDACYYGPWRERGGEAWTAWLGEIDRFRSGVAALLGGEKHCVCPQPNLSAALAKIVHGLPQDAQRRRILLCEEDFPSLGFVLTMARRDGFEPLFLPSDRDPQDPASWDSALDARVRLALITHAFSNRSARLPVAEITRLCAARGIVSVVDVAQTAGVIPIDLRQWHADFVIGSCVKFLCGGPGAGFLWASERAIAESQPLDVGWFSHADPFEFDIHHFRYAEDALRFWGGTPAVAPYVQAAHSIEALLAIGIDRIQVHNQALISQLHGSVAQRRIASVLDPALRGNTVLLRVQELAAAQVLLARAGVFADARAGCIRLAPHLYNDRGDIDRLVEILGPQLRI
jgi:selenocysteine lyase/cysteine desulfurase